MHETDATELQKLWNEFSMQAKKVQFNLHTWSCTENNGRSQSLVSTNLEFKLKLCNRQKSDQPYEIRWMNAKCKTVYFVSNHRTQRIVDIFRIEILRPQNKTANLRLSLDSGCQEHIPSDRHDNASEEGYAHSKQWKKKSKKNIAWNVSHSFVAHRLHGVENCVISLLFHSISMQRNVPLKLITESLISSSLMQTDWTFSSLAAIFFFVSFGFFLSFSHLVLFSVSVFKLYSFNERKRQTDDSTHKFKETLNNIDIHQTKINVWHTKWYERIHCTLTHWYGRFMHNNEPKVYYRIQKTSYLFIHSFEFGWKFQIPKNCDRILVCFLFSPLISYFFILFQSKFILCISIWFWIHLILRMKKGKNVLTNFVWLDEELDSAADQLIKMHDMSSFFETHKIPSSRVEEKKNPIQIELPKGRVPVFCLTQSSPSGKRKS